MGIVYLFLQMGNLRFFVNINRNVGPILNEGFSCATLQKKNTLLK